MCARWKESREGADQPKLFRKFNKWKVDNATDITSLLKCLMHPIDLLRLSTHVVSIPVKELKEKTGGLRVISAPVEELDQYYNSILLLFTLKERLDILL
jgi:hypothetical protein